MKMMIMKMKKDHIRVNERQQKKETPRTNELIVYTHVAEMDALQVDC